MKAGELLDIIDEMKKTGVADVTEIADKTGANRSYLSKFINGDPEKPVTPSLLRKLEKAYPFVFFKNNKNNGKSYLESRQDHKLTDKATRNKVPFYDTEATATMTETEMSPIHAPAGTIDVGDLLHDSQCAIRIYGNSMIPNYPPGCVVGLRKLKFKRIEPGEVYVVETKDSRLLKRLFYPEDDPKSENFYCYSDNTMLFEGGARHGKPAYPPSLIPREEVINLYVVTGVIKRNTNSIIIERDSKP